MSLEKVSEAERLIEKVKSWTEDEVESLPKFYREKAREFREGPNADG